jgi:hypothetical protein
MKPLRTGTITTLFVMTCVAVAASAMMGG